MTSQLIRRVVASALVCATSAACASAPPPPPEKPQLTFEQKMGWILRLEEDRQLRIPVVEAPPPAPVVTQGRRSRAPVPPPPPPTPDLIPLLKDEEARIRRRAALAIGRTRIGEGAAPLIAVLSGDTEPEVRQMAAFALGLIGQPMPSGMVPDVPGVADALVAALTDADPLVQGRAAEALGLIGHKAGAEPIGAMVATHVKAGALEGIDPDDLEYPKGATAEAARLGMYALVRLSAYEPLAAALSDASGNPVSRWWPVAYAFQRIANPKAAPVLLNLLHGQGGMTRAFAARGLGLIKEPRAIPTLVITLSRPDEVLPARIQAARALGTMGAAQGVEPLKKLIATPKLDPNLRLEATTALGLIGGGGAEDFFVDLLTDPWPSMRAAALTSLARVDADLFLTAISGLDPDPQWSVRAALATAMGTVDGDRARPRLGAMLDDSDQRVIPSVLNALVSVKAPDAERILTERLAAEDHVVRQAAAAGLGRLKATGAVQPLLQAYERAERDPTYVARAAILSALVELDRTAARPVLERALSDRDWAIRVRAAGLMETIDPASGASPVRPAPAAVVPELNNTLAMIAPTVSPIAYIDTDLGPIEIELAPVDAPRTVANFIELARRNFLGGTPFHRVVPDFVIQDGDPRGDGEGGPGYTIRDEINQRPYLRGTVGMALDWEDTGGSQFFITHSPQPHLDARYTVFGRVVKGLEVLDRIKQWDQIRTVRIWDGVNWIGPQ